MQQRHARVLRSDVKHTSHTPLSTVCRSCTLKDEKGAASPNWRGNSCIHVSSPTKASRRPAATSWSVGTTQESSTSLKYDSNTVICSASRVNEAARPRYAYLLGCPQPPTPQKSWHRHPRMLGGHPAMRSQARHSAHSKALHESEVRILAAAPEPSQLHRTVRMPRRRCIVVVGGSATNLYICAAGPCTHR